MSVECVPSNISSDVRCAVCGQGFLVYADTPYGRLQEVRMRVQHALRQHHANSAHPSEPFTVECNPEPQAALL